MRDRVTWGTLSQEYGCSSAGPCWSADIDPDVREAILSERRRCLEAALRVAAKWHDAAVAVLGDPSFATGAKISAIEVADAIRSGQ